MRQASITLLSAKSFSSLCREGTVQPLVIDAKPLMVEPDIPPAVDQADGAFACKLVWSSTDLNAALDDASFDQANSPEHNFNMHKHVTYASHASLSSKGSSGSPNESPWHSVDSAASEAATAAVESFMHKRRSYGSLRSVGSLLSGDEMMSEVLTPQRGPGSLCTPTPSSCSSKRSRRFASVRSMGTLLSARSDLLSEVDLINNETSRMLGACSPAFRGSLRFAENDTVFRLGAVKNNEFGDLDWSQRCHLRRVADLRKFVRRLFRSVKAEVNVVKRRSMMDEATERSGSRASSWASSLVKSRVFSTFIMLLIVYALWGTDLAAYYGHASQDSLPLAIWNTCVFFLFMAEVLLNCWVTPDYTCTGRFWVDLVATLSMVGDTWIVHSLVDTNVAAAGRGSRIMRMVRMGRSSRLMRLLRMSRTMQVLRLVPRVLRNIDNSTQELANLLLNKRLWHIFQYLDTDNTGHLTQEGRAYFAVVMMLEFPASARLFPESRREKLKTMVSTAHRWVKRKTALSISKVTHFNWDGENSFEKVVEYLNQRPEFARARQKCLEDVNNMKSSSHTVDKAIAAILLKVCMLLIFMLLFLGLMAPDVSDMSPLQGVVHLTTLAKLQSSELPSPMLCRFVREFEQRQSKDQRLLLLTLDNTVFWNAPHFTPCRSSHNNATAFPVNHDPVRMARDAMRSRQLQNHQFSIWCYPDVDCIGTVSSVALFDISSSMRDESIQSITYTTISVLMLVSFAAFFSTEISRLTNGTLMHPLWNLLDDMCSMKCMEVVGERIADCHGAALVTPSKRGSCRKCRDEILPAEELVKLDRALKNLKCAMRSWVKYVPSILFTQIIDSGIEFSIGCSQTEVSIFFCDILDFQTLCMDMQPKEAMDFLSQVLAKVTAIVEDNDGQMLEFIGDEILGIFNAPVPLVNHELAAVMAAVEAQTDVANILEGKVKLKMGVHSDTVLAGNIGSFTRMKYGVLGDGVNLAARVKSLNTRYGTSLLITHQTLAFEDAHEEFVTRPIGNLVLKGRKEPTLIYEVLGKTVSVVDHVIEAAALHSEAFDFFLHQDFFTAKQIFTKVNKMLANEAGDLGDLPSLHLIDLCEEYMHMALPDTWDGSEQLTKKVWSGQLTRPSICQQPPAPPDHAPTSPTGSPASPLHSLVSQGCQRTSASPIMLGSISEASPHPDQDEASPHPVPDEEAAQEPQVEPDEAVVQAAEIEECLEFSLRQVSGHSVLSAPKMSHIAAAQRARQISS